MPFTTVTSSTVTINTSILNETVYENSSSTTKRYDGVEAILVFIIFILVCVAIILIITFNTTKNIKETPPAKVYPERNEIKRTENPMYDSSESISTIESNNDRLCVNAVYEENYN